MISDISELELFNITAGITRQQVPKKNTTGA